MAPETFLNRFLMAHPQMEEAGLVAELPFYLSKEASHLWRQLPLATRNNWPEVSQALINHFNAEIFVSLRQPAFSQIKQKPGESVISFAERCRDGAENGFSTQGPEERERQASRQFLKGVDPSIKVWLPIRDQLNLNALTHAALEIKARDLPDVFNVGGTGGGTFGHNQSARVGNESEPHPPHTPSNGEEDSVHSLSSEIKKLVKAVSFRGGSRRGGPSRGGRGRGGPNRGRNSDFAVSTRYKMSDQTPEQGRMCFKCKGYGHIARYCASNYNSGRGRGSGPIGRGGSNSFNPSRGSFRSGSQNRPFYGSSQYQANAISEEFPVNQIGCDWESEPKLGSDGGRGEEEIEWAEESESDPESGCEVLGEVSEESHIGAHAVRPEGGLEPVWKASGESHAEAFQRHLSGVHGTFDPQGSTIGWVSKSWEKDWRKYWASEKGQEVERSQCGPREIAFIGGRGRGVPPFVRAYGYGQGLPGQGSREALEDYGGRAVDNFGCLDLNYGLEGLEGGEEQRQGEAPWSHHPPRRLEPHDARRGLKREGPRESQGDRLQRRHKGSPSLPGSQGRRGLPVWSLSSTN